MYTRKVTRHGSLLLFCLALVTTAACQHEAPPDEAHEEKASYLVSTPLRRHTDITREYVAQVRAIQHIEMRAQERGYLQGIYVDEGQQVRAGQTMFQVMPLIHQAELEKAEAEAEFTRLEFQNTKVLADGNIVSANELALSKAKLTKAEAEVALARVHRDLTAIKAPFSGIMGRFQVRLGSLIGENELLTTLSDNHSVWVYFNLSETEYLDYQAQVASRTPPPVRLVLANGHTFEQPGKVDAIEADFNNETGNIAFRAVFANPKGVLRHGETGKVAITAPLRDALLIPQKATFEVLDKRYVYVVDEHNVVHARLITVAHELPHVYVLASGLAENERVLIDGLGKVRDGAEIAVTFKSAAEVLAGLDVPAE